MEKNSRVESNVWKLYLVKAVSMFTLVMPIIVLFYQENGLTMQQVFLLQAIFSVVLLSLEVPTGYFADQVGRKTSIVIGGIIATAGFLTYALSYGFWGFLVAEIFLGIGASFISGSDSALLYDSLIETQEEAKFKKTEGRRQSLGMLAEGLSSVLGGFLALVTLRYPFYWDVAITVMVVPVALTLIEVKRHRPEKARESSFKAMVRLMKYALHDHTEIKWLIIYASLVGTSTLTMVWFIQVYWTATGVPLGLFGVAWAALMFTAAFFAWNAHRIEKFFGRKTSLVMLITFPVLGYLLLSSFWFVWSGLFVALFYVTRGLNNPIFADYLNKLVSSDIRATIMSVKNLVGRLFFVIVGPFVGWINDAFSLKAALVSSGIIFLAFGFASLLFMHKHKAL